MNMLHHSSEYNPQYRSCYNASFYNHDVKVGLEFERRDSWTERGDKEIREERQRYRGGEKSKALVFNNRDVQI